jgi:uncharacterized glyoxalase superfamily protein PhnB
MQAAIFSRTLTVLPVTDVQAAAGWYADVLGFQTIFLKSGEEPANYAVLQRGGLQVHLILDENPSIRMWTNAGTAYLYLKTTNIEMAYEEIKAKPVQLKQALEKAPWGLLGFLLSDPDGNEIRVEEETGLHP